MSKWPRRHTGRKGQLPRCPDCHKVWDLKTHPFYCPNCHLQWDDVEAAAEFYTRLATRPGPEKGETNG